MPGGCNFLVFENLKPEKHENLENVENLLDPACSSSQSQPTHLARDAPSLPAWVEEGFRAPCGGCLEGLKVWEGLGVGRYAGAWEGAWKRFSGVWRAYVLRSFVTVLLICIYGTPPCTHAFPDVCQEMRGSWGGKVQGNQNNDIMRVCLFCFRNLEAKSIEFVYLRRILIITKTKKSDHISRHVPNYVIRFFFVCCVFCFLILISPEVLIST